MTIEEMMTESFPQYVREGDTFIATRYDDCVLTTVQYIEEVSTVTITLHAYSHMVTQEVIKLLPLQVVEVVIMDALKKHEARLV